MDCTKIGENTVRTFLMNDKRNKNGWRVSYDIIKKTASKWIGIPGIEFKKCVNGKCGLDHTTGDTLEMAREKSHQSKVSEIIDVEFDDANKTVYAINKIIDPELMGKICNGKIKYVSASLWLDKVTNEQEINVTEKDTPLHLAYLDEDPAYGKVASVQMPCQCKVIISKMGKQGMEEEPEKTVESNDEMDDHQILKEVHSMLKAMTAPKKIESNNENQQAAKAKKHFDFNTSSTILEELTV